MYTIPPFLRSCLQLTQEIHELLQMPTTLNTDQHFPNISAALSQCCCTPKWEIAWLCPINLYPLIPACGWGTAPTDMIIHTDSISLERPIRIFPILMKMNFPWLFKMQGSDLNYRKSYGSRAFCTHLRRSMLSWRWHVYCILCMQFCVNHYLNTLTLPAILGTVYSLSWRRSVHASLRDMCSHCSDPTDTHLGQGASWGSFKEF